MGLVVGVAARDVEDGLEAMPEQDVLAGVAGDALVAVGDRGHVRVEFTEPAA